MSIIYNLSIVKESGNIFSKSEDSYRYVKESSGMNGQPHVCLVPNEIPENNLKKIFKKLNYDGFRINKTCTIMTTTFNKIVFLSRPDFVGLLTRLPNNYNSIIIHNIVYGLSFCEV